MLGYRLDSLALSKDGQYLAIGTYKEMFIWKN